MRKRIPKFKTDKEAEDFLEQDLSDYMHPANFKEVTFEFAPKDKSVTLRLSAKLLQALKGTARKRGVQYQRLIREAIEAYLKKAA